MSRRLGRGGPSAASAIAPILGLAGVGLFVASFCCSAWLTPGYDPLHDYISKLGARGQPVALFWNLSGFLAVGLLLAAFGIAFGRAIEDAQTGLCLALAGAGFALGAIPTDLQDETAPLSKAHFVSICLGLAGWCFAMARLGSLPMPDRTLKRSAGTVSLLVVWPFLAHAAGLVAAPMAHRLVLAAVFGWVIATSLALRAASRRAVASS